MNNMHGDAQNESEIQEALTPFPEVLARFKRGEPLLVLDDENRENEGDVIIAAEAVTPDVISFLMREARGLICVSISGALAHSLQLPYQVLTNNSPFQTPFAVSIDAREVAATGVTATSRAKTIQVMISPSAVPQAFVTPGHVFPLIANESGVLGRAGHTEGALDLARLAGMAHAGVLCEVLNPDGTMARYHELRTFAAKHGMAVTSIAAIRDYRLRNEIAVRCLSVVPISTDFGRFTAHTFADDAGNKEHLALVRGDLSRIPASYSPLVRIHSECLTGDVFGSRRCDCGGQLQGALRLIAGEGLGVVLYLRQEGRGIGLENKLRAYALQDQGRDTVEANLELGFKADERDFAVGAHILRSMGLQQIRLVTNNPQKTATMESYGISVVERIPSLASPDPCSQSYLTTKREKLGHQL
jgi:3,4-dihydroxy 2-butanone 4-phosphate synthase/GTP cyclohydrolase II